jgi:hypothetical protein
MASIRGGRLSKRPGSLAEGKRTAQSPSDRGLSHRLAAGHSGSTYRDIVATRCTTGDRNTEQPATRDAIDLDRLLAKVRLAMTTMVAAPPNGTLVTERPIISGAGSIRSVTSPTMRLRH